MHIITVILIRIIIITGIIIIVIQYMHINTCEYVHTDVAKKETPNKQKVYLYNQTTSTRIAVQYKRQNEKQCLAAIPDRQDVTQVTSDHEDCGLQ